MGEVGPEIDDFCQYRPTGLKTSSNTKETNQNQSPAPPWGGFGRCFGWLLGGVGGFGGVLGPHGFQYPSVIRINFAVGSHGIDPGRDRTRFAQMFGNSDQSKGRVLTM